MSEFLLSASAIECPSAINRMCVLRDCRRLGFRGQFGYMDGFVWGAVWLFPRGSDGSMCVHCCGMSVCRYFVHVPSPILSLRAATNTV